MQANLFLQALAAAGVASAQPAAAPSAPPVAPGARAHPALRGCTGAAEERAALQAERADLDRRIADVALGKGPKRKVGGGDVARGVAGTAATILLPFGLGVAVNAGTTLATRAGKKKKAAAPDGASLIARQEAIDSRLRALSTCP